MRAFAEATSVGQAALIRAGAKGKEVAAPGPSALTLSVGVAYSKSHSSNAEALFAAALEAAVIARRRGGNRVVMAEGKL